MVEKPMGRFKLDKVFNKPKEFVLAKGSRKHHKFWPWLPELPSTTNKAQDKGRSLAEKANAVRLDIYNCIFTAHAVLQVSKRCAEMSG
jgi:hypothetical protein